MTVSEKIRTIIEIGWSSYKNKVSSNLFKPENEKMMQLQFAQILQTISSLFEYEHNESIKILLEEPVKVKAGTIKRLIDIVIIHSQNNTDTFYPIEIKCFRKYTRLGDKTIRGAYNDGMYAYWQDIENIENYSGLRNYGFGTQLTLTDDEYYVAGSHQGSQVSIYSTNNKRENVTGPLEHTPSKRHERILLEGVYSMTHWEKIGAYYFIKQENNNKS